MSAFITLVKELESMSDEIKKGLSAAMATEANNNSERQQAPAFQQPDEVNINQLQQAYAGLDQMINQAKSEINKDPELKQAYDEQQTYNGPQDNRQQAYSGPQSYDGQQAYNGPQAYKPIKHLVITSRRSEPFSAASDFSRAAIEERIERGYQDTSDAIRDFKASMQRQASLEPLNSPPQKVTVP